MKYEDDFVNKILDDMDPEIKKFINEIVNNFVKWDIVEFFHKNVFASLRSNDIASTIGREPSKVKVEAEELVSRNVIVKEYKEGEAVYTYTKDEKIRRLVKKFINFCETKEGRLKTVYKILKSGNI